MAHLSIKEYEKQFESVYCKVTDGRRKIGDIYLEGMLKWEDSSAHDLAGPFKGNYAYFRLEDMGPLRKHLKDQMVSIKNFPGNKFFSQFVDTPWETESKEYPNRFYICGNDDFSWSMYFKSRADILTMYRENFREFEDISLGYIKSLGFVFTN